MLTGCRSVMAVLDRPGVLDDPHLRAYITREQERLGAMARALGTFPQPYTSHALVIGAGFGREWTPELDSQLAVYACERAAELALPRGPAQLTPQQLLPPPGVDGVTCMPASLRRTASVAPGTAMRGDVGFGAPLGLGIRAGGAPGGSVADDSILDGTTAGSGSAAGRGASPGVDEEEEEEEDGYAALVRAAEGVLEGVARVESVDDDGSSESTPLLARRATAVSASFLPAMGPGAGVGVSSGVEEEEEEEEVPWEEEVPTGYTADEEEMYHALRNMGHNRMAAETALEGGLLVSASLLAMGPRPDTSAASATSAAAAAVAASSAAAVAAASATASSSSAVPPSTQRRRSNLPQRRQTAAEETAAAARGVGGAHRHPWAYVAPAWRHLSSPPAAAASTPPVRETGGGGGTSAGGGGGTGGGGGGAGEKQQQREAKPPPPVLASFSREALEQRFCALLEYNKSIAAVLPLVDFSTAGRVSTCHHIIFQSKHTVHFMTGGACKQSDTRE
jgi:hypothetical protein